MPPGRRLRLLERGLLQPFQARQEIGGRDDLHALDLAQFQQVVAAGDQIVGAAVDGRATK